MSDNNTYLSRHLSSELEEALVSARIVNLIGPRQVGKTTLVRDLFRSGRFITLDDTQVLEAMEMDAMAQLESLTHDLENVPLIIDEAQRSKRLSLVIKQIVDRNRRKGQFILTGSSNVFTTTEVSDSLVGRMLTLKLWPLSVSEVQQSPVVRLLDWASQKNPNLTQLDVDRGITRKDYIDLILRGGFPEIRELAIRVRQRRHRDYINGIVERDVADLFQIRKTDVLRRLINQVAVRTASEMKSENISKDFGVKRTTIDNYIDVLISLSMVVKLGAWTPGESHREIKSAKYHFVDSGICCALRNLTEKNFNMGGNPKVLGGNPEVLGGILESFVFNEVYRILPMQEGEFRLYHWRHSDKGEIDILADGGDCLIGMEVKAASTVNSGDFKHLKWFANGPGKNRMMTGIVFYLGQEKLTFGERTFALPVSSLWGQLHL